MTPSLRAAVRAVLPRSASDAIFHAFVRRRAIKRTIDEFPGREVEHDYCGFGLRVAVEDPIAEAWYDRDWPMLPEIAELQRRGLRPGALVFNAGLHQGILALVLARIVGPQGRVIGIEPEPHNARVARRNIALNEAANMEVVEAAVSDRPGTLRFEENMGGHIVGTARGSIQVKATTIDDLAARFGDPDVLFVDVEGAEAAAVAGGRRTLERGRATWFIEVHNGLGLEPPGFPAPAEVLSEFPPERYDVVVAVESENYADTHAFAPLDGPVPEKRFFMIASPLAPAGG